MKHPVREIITMRNSFKKKLQIFEKNVRLSKQARWKQALLHPIHILLYFLYSRVPFLLHTPIRKEAYLFFGKKLVGVFPDSVFSFIYLYGFLEEDLTKALISFLKEDMVVINIGAHIGYFSALGAMLVGKSGSVHAFEATPRTYAYLHENMSHFHNFTTNFS